MELMSAEIKDLMAALANAQGVMEGASKSSTNPFFKSKYADLSQVWDACREPLSKNGLSIAQVINTEGDKTCLVTILGHSSGQWIKSILPFVLDKADPQTMGKCITYYRRYALAAMVGVYQEDDDAESVMRRTEMSNKSAEKPDIVPEYPKITKEQIEVLRQLLLPNPALKEQILKKVKKNLISDLESRDYDATLLFINKSLQPKEGAA